MGRETIGGNVWCSAPVTQSGRILERQFRFPLRFVLLMTQSESQSVSQRAGNNVKCNVCQLLNMAEAGTELIGGGITSLFVSSLLLEMSCPVFVYFD